MSDRPAAFEPTRDPVPAGAVVDPERSAARRACASERNTPFENCDRYASNSAGFVLFMIDCQNRPSNSALAAGEAADALAGEDGCEAGTAAGTDSAAVATARPAAPADRNASADEPSR